MPGDSFAARDFKVELRTAKKQKSKKQTAKKQSTKKPSKKTAQKKSKKTNKVTKSKKSTQRGIASVSSKSPAEKIAILEAKAKKSKQDYIEIADFYTKKKHHKKAIENLKLANKPQTVDVLDKLSRAYDLAGDKAEATRALELIRVEGKASPGQLVRLGNYYSETRKEIKSKNPVVLISSDPKEPPPEDPSSKYALLAVDVYRESISKAPKYDKAYDGLYKLYIDMKNNYDARLIVIEALDKLREPKYWLNISCRLEVEQNYYDNAKKICQKAILKDSQNPDNHVYLALAFKNTDNPDQARKILTSAAKRYKKSEVTQWNAGQMNCSIRNWELATEQFKQCVKANPESGRCHLNLGKTLFELKKYNDSLESLMKACPYIKGVEVELRRFSYDLEKIGDKKTATQFQKYIDKCSTQWFEFAKKHKEVQTYSRNTDKCFYPD